jgi:hypothetical protein
MSLFWIELKKCFGKKRGPRITIFFCQKKQTACSVIVQEVQNDSTTADPGKPAGMPGTAAISHCALTTANGRHGCLFNFPLLHVGLTAQIETDGPQLLVLLAHIKSAF